MIREILAVNAQEGPAACETAGPWFAVCYCTTHCSMNGLLSRWPVRP
jgi:hypothetical protein